MHYTRLDHEIGSEIRSSLAKNGDFDVIEVTDDSPHALDLVARAQIVDWCHVFVMLTSRQYQRSKNCLNLASYARDAQKSIVGVIVQNNFVPCGRTALFCAATGKHIIASTDTSAACVELKKRLKGFSAHAASSVSPKPNLVSDGFIAPRAGHLSNSASGVAIQHCSSTKEIALILKRYLSKKFQVKFLNPDEDNSQLIAECSVLVSVMSYDYQNSVKCKEELCLALVSAKQIVPILGNKGYRMTEWVALGMAGKPYFTLTEEQDFLAKRKTFLDTTTIQDVVYAIEACLNPADIGIEQREEKEKEILREKLKDVKRQCENLNLKWPPPQRQRALVDRGGSKLLVDVLKNVKKSMDLTTDLTTSTIHHHATRVEISPPKPLFNSRGIPTLERFDVMFSYQCDIEEMARNLYMDMMTMRNLRVWMDVYGDLVGNIGDSVAAAVERSTVIMVFLTNAYQSSPNCQMEFKYAKVIQKPLVIVFAEPPTQLILQDWVAEYIAPFPKFTILQYNDVMKVDRGYPLIDRITNVVRDMAVLAEDVQDTGESEDLLVLREFIENGLTSVAERSGKSRFQKCGRCGQEFSEEKKDNCKTHQAYYLDGTIISGKWVCCSQPAKDALGCQPAMHTTAKQVWTQDPTYGTFTWQEK